MVIMRISHVCVRMLASAVWRLGCSGTPTAADRFEGYRGNSDERTWWFGAGLYQEKWAESGPLMGWV